MKKILMLNIIVIQLILIANVQCYAKETPHYDVVYAYIRSLGTIHNLQKSAQAELKEDDTKENPAISKMMSAIRNSTRMKLELKVSISDFKRMKLNKPFDQLLPTTIFFYKEKVKLHEEVIRIAKYFTTTMPQKGVDYNSMAARMPEITASLEYLDKSIFESMVMVFALLIDKEPDKDGHMSHLIITKEERQKLIDYIELSFGSSLNNENKNWTVASAALLREYLLKDFKCKDEVEP